MEYQEARRTFPPFRHRARLNPETKAEVAEAVVSGHLRRRQVPVAVTKKAEGSARETGVALAGPLWDRIPLG